MKLQINLAQSHYKNRPGFWVYLPLAVLFSLSLVVTYFWYSSITQDLARYRERLNKIEEKALKAGAAAEEALSPQKKGALIKEAEYINIIIRNRALSWSGLLSQLEQEIIPNISLISISPRVDRDKVKIDIRGVGKDLITVTRFMDKLEKSLFFQNVFLSRSSDTELSGERLLNFDMEVEYTER